MSLYSAAHVAEPLDDHLLGVLDQVSRAKLS